MNQVRDPIRITCLYCPSVFYGELSKWHNVHTCGEMWTEICPTCKTRYEATLTFEALRPSKSRKPLRESSKHDYSSKSEYDHHQ